MPKSRDKFKLASSLVKNEKALDSKSIFGIFDPTPKLAVRNIIQDARTIVNKNSQEVY